jgi:hypothetical protein
MSLLSSYQDLITSEHKDKPKYMATVTALLRHSTDIYETAVYMDDYFDLDESEGKQEDILGILVGADREVSYQPDHADSSILNDEMYRVLIKSKIAKNAWKGGIEDLQEIWRVLFGQPLKIIDNQDMTIDVDVAGFSIGSADDAAIKEMIQHGLIVPKPQSVRLNFLMQLDDALIELFLGIAQAQLGVRKIEIQKPEGCDIQLFTGMTYVKAGLQKIGIQQPEDCDIPIHTGSIFTKIGTVTIPVNQEEVTAS